MRSSTRPPAARADNHAMRNVRALPRCSPPLGVGARRPTGAEAWSVIHNKVLDVCCRNVVKAAEDQKRLAAVARRQSGSWRAGGRFDQKDAWQRESSRSRAAGLDQHAGFLGADLDAATVVALAATQHAQGEPQAAAAQDGRRHTGQDGHDGRGRRADRATSAAPTRPPCDWRPAPPRARGAPHR